MIDFKTLGKKIAGNLLGLPQFGRKVNSIDSKQLGQKNRRSARMSNDSYKGVDDRKDIDNYKYVRDLSDHNTAVYREPNTNKVKIAMRGSTTKNDWLNNRNIVSGLYENDPDVRKDLDTYKRIKSKYGDSTEISSTGHSRGGFRSRQLAYKTGTKSTGFNSGYSVNPREMLRNLRCRNPINPPKYCKNLTNIRTDGDLVSYSGRRGYGNQINTTNKNFGGYMNSLQGHSINNFL